jgi:hypothetical protein
MPSKQARHYLFTLFPEVPSSGYQAVDLPIFLHEFKNNFRQCRYVCAQVEQCPETKRIHYQGYAQFRPQLAFNTIKAAYPTIHLEPPRGSSDENVTYCSKKDTQVVACQSLGNLTFVAGKRKFNELKYERDYTKHPQVDKEVYIFCGPTARGKTHDVRLAIDGTDLYEVPARAQRNTVRWIGEEYKHHPYVLIDEWDFDQFTSDFLKLALDRSHHILPTRMGGRGNILFNPVRVWLCTNRTLAEVAEYLDRDPPLARRITHITDYSNRSIHPSVRGAPTLGKAESKWHSGPVTIQSILNGYLDSTISSHEAVRHSGL